MATDHLTAGSARTLIEEERIPILTRRQRLSPDAPALLDIFERDAFDAEEQRRAANARNVTPQSLPRPIHEHH